MTTAQCLIVGRSSSHFTRVTRVFAHELGVGYRLKVVRDLQSSSAEDYAGNPALKVPVLVAPSGTWFGALHICQALYRLSTSAPHVVWPHDLQQPLLANAQELVVQAMATEGSLIMQLSRENESSSATKLRSSLGNCLEWLEAHATQALAGLAPERDLSFLEVSLFCLMEHLEFRGVLSTEPFGALREFSERFGQRRSAQCTPFVFD